jgi:prepilin-type N-terminal cleavage/methylation domain-containing protein
MKKAVPAGRQGFTLVELLVTVGITGILIVSVVGILGSFFNAKTSAETSDLIRTAASGVMEKLKTNMLEASGDINCFSGVGETAIEFETNDGGRTKLSCEYDPNKISSESAHGIYNLLANGVVVVDCAEFVNCSTLPSTEVTLVNFKFSLGVSGDSFGENSWTFETKVAPRE